MQASLIFSDFCVDAIEAFQDDVGLGRLHDGHHFNGLILNLDDLGERCFTDFTLEFCKIVREGYVIDLFFDLAVNPLLEAPNVNLRNTSLT